LGNWNVGYPNCRIQRGEDMNPDYSTDVWFVEVYDLTKCLAPLFGTGTMDVDENDQPFGSFLGSVDSTKHLTLKKRFSRRTCYPINGSSYSCI
jgi:hypothetical protein